MNTSTRKEDLKSIVKKTREEILKDKKEREKKLYKKRLEYLEKARLVRQKNIEKREKEKLKKHYKYFREKVKKTFSLWWGRVKEWVKSLIERKKIPDIRPIEEIVVKEISKQYIIIKMASPENRIGKKIKNIEEGIEELKKPLKEIKSDVMSGRKKIKKLLSPAIYNKTKELIRLEEEQRRIEKELRKIRIKKSL